MIEVCGYPASVLKTTYICGCGGMADTLVLGTSASA